MNVLVKLFDEDEKCTRSRFYFNGELKGYGIEDEFREVKVKGETRIPDGRYKLDLRYSPKFSKSYYRDDEGNIIRSNKRLTEALKQQFHTPHELVWVTNVPNFEFILWHWGNYEHNTDGCYLVGSSLFTHEKYGKSVGKSREKYEEIYPILWKAINNEECFVIYERDQN